MDPVILKKKKREREKKENPFVVPQQTGDLLYVCSITVQSCKFCLWLLTHLHSHKVRRLCFNDLACITLEHVRIQSLCACLNTAWMSASNSWLANTECKWNPFTWSWVHSVCALVCLYRMQEARYRPTKIQNISESMTTLAAAPGGINMLSTDVSA